MSTPRKYNRCGSADSRPLWAALALAGFAAGLAGLLIPIESRGAIPLSCLFWKLTGQPCPFCGMTRAFLAAGHGMWTDALRQSPLGTALYAGAWALAVAGAVNFVRNAPAPRTSAIPARFWLVCAIVLAANWLYRIWAGVQ